MIHATEVMKHLVSHPRSLVEKWKNRFPIHAHRRFATALSSMMETHWKNHTLQENDLTEDEFHAMISHLRLKMIIQINRGREQKITRNILYTV